MDPSLETFIGMKYLLAFVGLVIAVIIYLMANSEKQEIEDDYDAEIRALLGEVCLERREKKSATLLNVTLTKRIRDLENCLQDVSKEQEKVNEIQSTTVQFNKQRLEAQTLEDKIRLLESEKQLMEKEMATQENARNVLEDEIAKMKAENKRVAKDGTALQELSETLNNKVMSLNAQLAKKKCQLLQQEEATGQLETKLQEMREEKVSLTNRTRDLESALNHCKTEKEGVQLRVQELQEQDWKLSKDNGSLQCQLQEKDMKLDQQVNFLKAKDRQLEEAARLASNLDEKRNALERELRNLQRKHEELQLKFDNDLMRKEHLDKANDGLQKKLSVLTRWHESMAAGFNLTERKLE